MKKLFFLTFGCLGGIFSDISIAHAQMQFNYVFAAVGCNVVQSPATVHTGTAIPIHYKVTGGATHVKIHGYGFVNTTNYDTIGTVFTPPLDCHETFIITAYAADGVTTINDTFDIIIAAPPEIFYFISSKMTMAAGDSAELMFSMDYSGYPVDLFKDGILMQHVPYNGPAISTGPLYTTTTYKLELLSYCFGTRDSAKVTIIVEQPTSIGELEKTAAEDCEVLISNVIGQIVGCYKVQAGEKIIRTEMLRGKGACNVTSYTKSGKRESRKIFINN